MLIEKPVIKSTAQRPEPRFVVALAVAFWIYLAVGQEVVWGKNKYTVKL